MSAGHPEVAVVHDFRRNEPQGRSGLGWPSPGLVGAGPAWGQACGRGLGQRRARQEHREPRRLRRARAETAYYITTDRDLTIYDISTPGPAAGRHLLLPEVGRTSLRRGGPRHQRGDPPRLERRPPRRRRHRQDRADAARDARRAPTSTRSPACSTAPGRTARTARSSTCATRPTPVSPNDWQTRRHRVRARRDRGRARASC